MAVCGLPAWARAGGGSGKLGKHGAAAGSPLLPENIVGKVELQNSKTDRKPDVKRMCFFSEQTEINASKVYIFKRGHKLSILWL